MEQYKIKCTFRRETSYLQNEDVLGAAPTAIVELTTHRCHVEAILSHMNVESYQIIECSYELQIMREPKMMPLYYYEEVKQ
ncbi:MAG: hypothetical protein MJZ37_08525 [Bacilli bacterium]|nr:hypothetical protein [Bacilli bacterium]